MKYIITGQDGLIGRYLKRELDKEHECVMQVDQRSGFNILNLRGVNLNQNTQKTDMLIHTAAQCKINEAVDKPDLPHINNCNGTHEVLEFCRANKIPKMINFSSSRVLSPEENPYTASKKYGENLVKAYHDCYGLEYITVRPSTVYGPVHDITSRLITTWCENALKGKELKIYGDKNKTLDFTYVTDFVTGIKLLIDNWDKAKNQSYNISGEEEVNLLDLACFIIKKTKFKSTLGLYSAETAQPQQVKVDISKMKALGFKPKIKIEEGVRRVLDFYREND